MPCSGCSNDGIIKLVLQHDIRKNTHSITKQSNRFRHELDIPEETNETAQGKEIKRKAKNEGIKQIKETWENRPLHG